MDVAAVLGINEVKVRIRNHVCNNVTPRHVRSVLWDLCSPENNNRNVGIGCDETLRASASEEPDAVETGRFALGLDKGWFAVAQQACVSEPPCVDELEVGCGESERMIGSMLEIHVRPFADGAIRVSE